MADARGVEPVDRRDVGVRLRRVAETPAGVVVVHPVAPLVVEDGRDLTGVAAAAAALEEVDRAEAVDGVAGVVDVDVGVELGLEPGVAGQPTLGQLDELVQLVEAGAGGRRVARGGSGGYAVVLAVDPAEVERAAVRGLADRAAGVVDRHERAREVERDRPAGIVVKPGAVGQIVRRREAGVQERHRVAGLHRAAGLVGGADLGGGQRVDPADDLLFGVERLVLEGDHLSRVGVHQDLPGLQPRRATEAERPDEPVAVARPDRSREPVAVLVLAGRVRDDLEDRIPPERVRLLLASGEVVADGDRLLVGDRRQRQERDVAPGLGAQEYQVAVADRRHQMAVTHRNAAELLGDPDVPEVLRDLHGPRRSELGRVDPDHVGVLDHELPDQLSDHAGLDGRDRSIRLRAQILELDAVAHARPGDQRHAADQGGQRTRPGVHEEAEPGTVVALEAVERRRPRALAQRGRIDLHVGGADVEIAPQEPLLLELPDPGLLLEGNAVRQSGNRDDHRQNDRQEAIHAGTLPGVRAEMYVEVAAEGILLSGVRRQNCRSTRVARSCWPP